MSEVEELRAQLTAAQAQLAEAPSLWSCPDCAFTFDAGHTDADGGYSCPLCGEIAAEARLEAVRAVCSNVASDLTIWLVETLPSAPWKAPIIEARNRLREAAALSAAPDDTLPTFFVCQEPDCRCGELPEPPASDEPARCEHGQDREHTYCPHSNSAGTCWQWRRCPGPAASGTPDGGS